MATPRPLTITVENAGELLDAGLFGAGAVIEIQSSATEAGAYSALTGTGSTPTKALIAGTRTYTAFDPNGDWTTWYRTRYRSADSLRFSVDWTGDASWATRPGHAPFQAGDETGGLLCSLYDVQQELGGTVGADTGNDENILDKIRQVSAAIEGYTGRWFAPRPLSGTTTYRMHTRAGRMLRLPKGIRSITTLSTAVQDQPASGGTYTAQAASSYYIDPPDIERDASWPGTSVRFLATSGSIFYNASFGVEIVGAFGWASVPYDIQGVAIRATVRRYIGKGGGGTAVAIGPEGTEFLLPDMSGSDRRVLDHYRHIPA